MGENANQGKMAMMLISYLLVFGLGAAGGYFLSGNAKTTTATNTTGQTQNGSGFGGFGGSGGQRPTGFGGRATGTVTAVNGNTITVSDPRGGTQTITLTDSTTYKQVDAGTKDKIVVGATISATADTTTGTDTSGGITAATVTVQ